MAVLPLRLSPTGQKELPLSHMAPRNYNDVNVIVGWNSDEGSLFCRPMPVEMYRARVNSIYGDFAPRIFEQYPATNEQEACYALSDIFRDGSFGWCSYAWGNLQSRTGKGKVYMYYFDQDSENSSLMPTAGNGSFGFAFTCTF